MISTMLVASEVEVALPGLKLLINNQWVASESGRTDILKDNTPTQRSWKLLLF